MLLYNLFWLFQAISSIIKSYLIQFIEKEIKSNSRS